MEVSTDISVGMNGTFSSFNFFFLSCKTGCKNIAATSSNQRLGECVRPKMESQVVAKEQGCWQMER